MEPREIDTQLWGQRCRPPPEVQRLREDWLAPYRNGVFNWLEILRSGHRQPGGPQVRVFAVTADPGDEYPAWADSEPVLNAAVLRLRTVTVLSRRHSGKKCPSARHTDSAITNLRTAAFRILNNEPQPMTRRASPVSARPTDRQTADDRGYPSRLTRRLAGRHLT